MNWCLECGEAGKPEPATTTVEGDPLCAGCAKARGVTVEKPVFNDEFVNRRMAEHKASVEKLMAEQCGCGRDVKHRGRCSFRRGTEQRKSLPRRIAETVLASPDLTPKKATPAPAGPVRVAENHPDPDFLDTIWNALPDDHKRDALRAVFDAIL